MRLIVAALIAIVSSSLFTIPSLPIYAHQAPQLISQISGAGQDFNATGFQMSKILSLSNSTEYSFFPQLAMSNHTLYVLWTEGNGLFGGYERNANQTHSLSIVYRTSGDNGTAFEPTQALHNYSNPHTFNFPVVTSDPNSSRIFVAWADNSTNNSFDIYFARSSLNGTGFEAPVKLDGSRLQDNATDTLDQSENDIADSRSSGIAKKTHLVSSPQLAVSTSGRVYLMWTETLAMLVKSPSSPSSSQNASNAGVMNASYRNSSIIDGNDMDNFNLEDYLPRYNVTTNVFLAASNNSGASFGETRIIRNSFQNSTSSYLPIHGPNIVASGDNVYVVTSTGSAMDALEKSSLQLYRSTNNGSSFEVSDITAPDANETRFAVHAFPVVTNSTSDSLYMLVTVAENKTESAINEQGARINRFLPSFFDLEYSEYFMKSENAGGNFTEPIQVINRTSSFLDASMAISHDGKLVYLTWSDPGIDFYDMLLGGLTSRQYISPEKLEELNTAGSTLVRASSDGGNTFSEIQRLNSSKPSGDGISFGSNPANIVSFGDQSLIVIKTKSSSGGFTERILPSSELLLWLSSDGASSFEDPIKISGSQGDVDFGMSAMFGGNSILMTQDALYLVWSAADYGDYSGTTASSDIYLRRIGS